MALIDKQWFIFVPGWAGMEDKTKTNLFRIFKQLHYHAGSKNTRSLYLRRYYIINV